MTSYPVNISRRLRRHATAALTAAAALTMQSCSDALESLYGPEGENTTFSLSIELPQMAVQTRSDISDEQASEVDKVWVGIYDARTGLRKTALTVDKYESPNPHDRKLLIDKIKTTSGMSHIAAVANITRNFGVISDEPDAGLQPIADLLDQADTWDKFQRIVTKQTLSGNVNAPIGTLPMSGIYHGEKTTDPDNWVEAYQTPYYIPAGDNITMPGAVHLRRLLSQSRFNIISGANVTVTPISWQVFNTPDVVYIYEHETNATDDIETAFGNKHNVRSGLFHQFEKAKAKLSDGTEKDCMTFDFWQFENKHDGLEKYDLGNGDYYGAETYADREREWKTADTDGSGKETNTGVYKSLCSTEEGGTYNNATYVEIKAKVEYYVTIAANGTETVVPANTTGATHRIGYSTYTVHLGYCEGENESEKSRDFNCRRNTKYTYNVTVEGLNKIKVEAMNEGELQPGTNGDITDIEDENIIELDAHYCTFNITLTNRQRQNLKWLLKVPFGENNRIFSYFSEDYKEGGVHAGTDLSNNPFYTWIHFKPTTDANTLRVYNDGGSNPDLMTLLDLNDVNGNPGVDKDGTAYTTMDDTELYYTVFVDEYFYTKDNAGNDVGTNEWREFVNKDPRILWLVIDELHTSGDKESMFITSDYMIKQNSIMTYYNDKSSTGIGIERENETFGFNLGWSSTANTRLKDDYISKDNGRYNMWYYITNGNPNVTTASGGNHIKWNGISTTSTKSIKGTRRACLAPASRAKVNSVQYPLANESPEPNSVMTYPVYKQNTFSSSSRWPSSKKIGYNPVSGGTTLNEIITACMNRNRDENGDGYIDRNELKWYLPTVSKYTRIVLGRNSITPPLMDFSLTPYYTGYNDQSDYNTRFHYASSDKKIIWSEEGMSTSGWGADWDAGAWQVRCVRDLGLDISALSKADPVSPAFVHDKDNCTFEMVGYNTEVLRAATAGHLNTHDVTSNQNQPATMFEYAKDDCNSTNTSSELFNDYLLNDVSIASWIKYVNDNSVCGKYSQESDGSDRGKWRVPNQKELVMIQQEGILTTKEQYWMSCTREHYDMKAGNGNRRFFIVIPGSMTVNDGGSENRRVRCVRDIIR